MKEECWAPVSTPGYEHLYQVSSHGRVRSLPRQTPHGIRGGRILKWRKVGPDGRAAVFLCNGKSRANCKVHLLVLNAFVGPRPLDLIGCHNDGNMMNNHLSNLRWDTHKSNGKDRIIHGVVARL